MKNIKSIVWGIILIIVGVILAGNELDLFSIDIFFDGWWTLFIIIPSFINIFVDEDKTGSIIGVIIGVVLLLACQDVVDMSKVWGLIFPLIIVLVGLSLIFKNTFKKELSEQIKEMNKEANKGDELCATFSGINVNYDKEEFTGKKVTAVFGGVKLDLRDAIIKKDVVINTTSIFGGIDIYLPKSVNVKVKSNSIFGGVTNKNKKSEEGKKTIYINATCLFGGVELK